MAEKNKNPYIDPSNARIDDQKKVMENINEDGVCPFCTENLTKYHKRPILHEGKYWLFTESQWPYENTKHHLLAIAKEHVDHIKDLPPEAGQELFEVFSRLARERKMAGGGVAMRFGSPNEHGSYGSTVIHLHAHLLEPDLKNLPDEDPKFKFKFGEKR